MKVLEKIKIVSNKVENNSTFSVIILKCKTNKNSFAGKLLGRGLEEWVSFACRGHDIKIVDYNSKENILNSVRGKINNRSDYTIILLSTTPLLQTATINDIKEYCHYKNIGVCKLPAGYVVNNNIFLDKTIFCCGT